MVTSQGYSLGQWIGLMAVGAVEILILVLCCVKVYRTQQKALRLGPLDPASRLKFAARVAGWYAVVFAATIGGIVAIAPLFGSSLTWSWSMVGTMLCLLVPVLCVILVMTYLNLWMLEGTRRPNKPAA